MSQDAAAERTARRGRIVEAATLVFLRYGFARTTMGDLADATNISRPALYILFPSKDALFTEVIRRLSDEKLAELRAALPGFHTLGERLAYCCENWGTHGFDLIQLHPDAKDLFDLSFPAVQEMYAAFEVFLAELMSERTPIRKLKVSPAKLARNLVFAMRGFREAAHDGIEMRKMIALEVKIVVAALG